ncbi:MAG: substrate-binding domain-containing protein [Hyphomicrobium sp.]|uniref:substrate-binding domain-containing protein n=1 Tax=Hyphomicrobium sp. TaxID=82 RepID=UPI003D0DBEE8
MAVGVGAGARGAAAGGTPEAFVIQGSNTIGARLMPALVEAFAVSIGGKTVTLVGSQPEEVEIRLQTDAGGTLASVRVHSHGSGTAVPGLISGDARLGMLSRPIDAKEVEALKAAGIADLRATASEHVVALDGVLVLTARGNPVKALSMHQVAGIFSGAITDWAALGGQPGRIQVYARDDKSGTFDTFNALVLKPRKAALTAGAQRFESSEELSDSVARDANGIGFVGFAYLRNAKALEIANECGIAYAPTVFNVKTEQYPLSRRLFLYDRNVAPGSVAERLLAFVMSPAAQDVVRAEGFVDQGIELLDDRDQVMRLADGIIGLEPDADPAVLKDLAASLKHSSRVSTTLVFRMSSTTLDSKGEADVARIAEFVRALRASDPAKGVILAGFTDSAGNFAANQALSQARAEQLKAALVSALGPDVPPSVVVARGYSKLLPTSCNTTKEGRNRNRRVEVWVK